MIARLRKRNGILTDKQDQYKEALYALNKEVKELTKKLKEEGAKREKEQQAKEAIEKELTALLG